jgi:hypothetical protein
MEPTSFSRPIERPNAERTWRRDLAMVLRRYGFLGLDAKRDGQPITSRLRVTNAAFEDILSSPDTTSIIVADCSAVQGFHGLDVRDEREGGLVYKAGRTWFGRRVPAYRPLLPYVSFSGEALTPVLSTADGRSVIGWWSNRRRRHLVIGLQVAEELIRYTQGDPRKVVTAQNKTLWGFGHERPTFLFEDHILSGYELVPFADRLGYLLAELLAKASGLPLLSVLPKGARGAVLLTGDDDEAYLEKYDEQLSLLEDFPITYMMLPHTKHTPETLARMPRNVQFGTHIDSLPDPSSYDRVCAEQTDAVRRLTKSNCRSVRNHGHLNRDYWGHLGAWDDCGLTLDLNIRGYHGSCTTGSFLPFRVRRVDGSWSKHMSLFSTFSDGMLYVDKWSQQKQIKCITGLADQISRSDPGVIVVNLHPQNVGDFHGVHRAVVKLGRRNDWIGLGAESYIDWLAAMESISLIDTGDGFELHSSKQISELAYSWPGQTENKRTTILADWQGRVPL